MNILVLSVHPDDETLGCGGTMLKHKADGDSLYWLILTEGKEELGYSAAFLEARRQQVDQVAEDYGITRTFSLGFPTTQLHRMDFSELMEGIGNVVQEVRPEVVYTINRSDIHTDHQVAARAVMSCTKSFRNPFIRKLLMYECISETEIMPPLPEHLFIPQVYVDISSHMERKLEIMQRYASEIQEPPLPRSLENIRALGRFRGATVAVDYAEAFMLLREVL